MTTKTKTRKITAEDRDSYPLNNSLQARVTAPVRAANALKRALDTIHRECADKVDERIQDTYQEIYAEAMRAYVLMLHACRGEDAEAVAEFFPDA